VPIFRELANTANVELTVLFAMIPDSQAQGEGFGVSFEWDLPLLEGYRYEVLENRASNPGVTHFSGCDTPGIGEWLDQNRPDAVIVNGWVVRTCLQALWACKKLDIPCLVRGEANDLRERAWWKRRLQALLVRQYEACLYIGKANRAFYLSRGVSAERLFPARYCIENTRFWNTAAEFKPRVDAIRQSWNIADKATCFMYCGKFEQKKHPVELIEAFRVASSSVENMHLLMVGDGDLREQCERLVQKHNLKVTFTGFLNQTEIIQAYLAADCLVLPSDAGETWGLVANEAMACGIPAIVSDLVGCASDLIRRGDTGDVFKFGDWAGFSQLMVYYAGAPEKLKQMGNNASVRVGEYSPERAAQGICKALEHVLQSQ
jgi:glycosyltransferase involved in cell wall biosynthesis